MILLVSLLIILLISESIGYIHARVSFGKRKATDIWKISFLAVGKAHGLKKLN